MSEMRASMPAAVKGLRLGEHPEPHAVWSLEEAAWIEQRDQQWRLWAESAAPAPAAHPRQLVSVSSIDVERLHMDTQAAKAAPYVKQRAIMVPPALYFYDAKGTLLEVLQGELKPDKLKAAARL